jgi:hypothetical protein
MDFTAIGQDGPVFHRFPACSAGMLELSGCDDVATVGHHRGKRAEHDSKTMVPTLRARPERHVVEDEFA